MAAPAHGTSAPSPTARNLPPGTYDRVPPHNLNAEVSVLGSMLLSRNAVADVSEVVGPEDFYRGAHRTIFEAARDLYNKGEPLDTVTLADELDRRNALDDVGGIVALTDIVAQVPTAANALYYARIVADQALRRRLIEAGTQITHLGYQPEQGIDEAVDSAEQVIFDVAQRGRATDIQAIKPLLHESFELLEKLAENKTGITGLPTGFVDFDDLTAGLQPGNLVIVAARPAMGKCVGSESLVLEPTTGELLTIAEMVGRAQAGTPHPAVAMDGRYRLATAAPSDYLDNGVRDVFRLRTKLGRELVATANHPLFTLDGWVPLADLEPGARIATPRSLPFFGRDRLPDAEVALLAYLIGDGTIGVGTPTFVTTSETLLRDMEKWTADLSVRMVRNSQTRFDYRLTNGYGKPNPVSSLLAGHGLMGTKSATKFVPSAIFRAPKDQVALFLNRLFACDGCVYVGEKYAQITYTSISEQLIRQVQHLLLRFGILAKLRKMRRAVYEGTDKQAWELQITDGEGVLTFAGEIGILGKEAKLRQAVAMFRGRERFRPNRDVVPMQVWDAVLEAKDERPWRELSLATGRPPNHNWHVGRRMPSRALLTELADALDDHVLQDLAASDIYWDEVVSIEPAGQDRVYDLTVPGLHNFVADDVIVHNSTLVANMAAHVTVETRVPVAFFSLEMSAAEVVMRLLSAESRVNLEKLRTGRLEDADWAKLSQAMGRLAEAPLFIDDTPGINLMEIRSKCRRIKQKHGLDLVVVDYLQLMQSHRRVENRVQEVSELSRGLKILAKELDLPVIALSQLSRKPEDRARDDRRPQLADLRESGCLTADARVLRADTGAEVTIGELSASGERDIPIWTVDHDYKIVRGTMSRAFPTGVKETFRLRLASGRQVDASANHPFLTYEGWTRLDELCEGSRIAVPRTIPQPDATEVWDDDRVVLLAHMLGDGCMAPRQPIHYTSADPANLDAVEQAARSFGITPRRVQQGNWWHTYLPSPHHLTHGRRNPIAEWLDTMGVYGKRSGDKFIPDEVFRLKDPQVALFLRHLWATDGHVSVRNRTAYLSYASKSRRMIDGLQLLLLRFGIHGRLRSFAKGEHEPTHQLWIEGATAQHTFLDEVGVHGARSEPAQAAATLLRTVTAAPRLDTVPKEVWTRVETLRVASGLTKRQLATQAGLSALGTGHHGVSRNRLAAVAGSLGDEGLARLADSDLFWDKVSAIEPLGAQPVFDATVPGTHNFIANNIVLENSIEQDADLVAFIYRDEVYNPEETSAKGEAELIVAKHRNGPLKTVRLSFLGHHSRFANMARGPVGGGGGPL